MASQAKDDGFVLPYVLVTLAVMSIILSMVADRMMSVSDTVSRFSENADAELQLATLEARALHMLLTSVPTDEGLALYDSADYANLDDPLIAEEDRPKAVRLISGQGTRIYSEGDQQDYIEFQDIIGLIPLNSQNEDFIAAYLRSLDLPSLEAQSLAAKLADYTDQDTRRRFRGGERIDYRNRDLPPPTNRPIRNHDEVRGVLGWSEMLKGRDMQSFIDETSTHDRTTRFNSDFANTRFLSRLEKSNTNPQLKRAFSASGDLNVGQRTSNVWRVKLAVPLSDGRLKVRAIEVERRLGSLNEPFASNILYERVISRQGDSLDRTSSDF